MVETGDVRAAAEVEAPLAGPGLAAAAAFTEAGTGQDTGIAPGSFPPPAPSSVPVLPPPVPPPLEARAPEAPVAAEAPGSRLNLLLTDGTAIWATAWDHALSLRMTDDAALVASEPIDDRAGWEPVPDRCLVVARPGDCWISKLAATTGDP